VSQHPPLKQTWPSQQGWPAPPQFRQPTPLPGSHAVSDCVQKSLAFPAPFGLPGQQASPLVPQEDGAPPVHRFRLQVPSVEPHELPEPMQRPPTQQRFCEHELRAQQGCAVPPHATIEPSLQTVPALGPSSPLARQMPLLQQPPPAQVLPQHAWPGPPQARQVPALQTLPAPQVPPVQHG
jgi:hypothetical protein